MKTKKTASEKPGNKRIPQLIDLIQELPMVPGENTLMAIVQYGDRKERLPIDSQKFREYLLASYHACYEDCPTDRELCNAITIVKVEWEAEQKHPLAYRVNRIGDTIYYDLFNDRLSYAEITPDGCDMKDNGYEYFISNPSQKPQVTPIFDKDGLDRLHPKLSC